MSAQPVLVTRAAPMVLAPNEGSLRRMRWAVRATLTLGVAASVAANVLHARPNPISQTIAAWPPCALLLTVELIARVPVYRRILAAVRLLATAAIAGIAAFVSYTHMAAVASAFGETGAAPMLLPISVDGLIVVASVSLVELAGRVRAIDRSTAAPQAAQPPMQEGSERANPPAVRGRPGPGRPPLGRPASVADLPDADGAATGPARADVILNSGGSVPSQTAAAVMYWRRRDPSMQPADIAAKLGRSARTVRRYWPREPDPVQQANGHRDAKTPGEGSDPT